MVISVPLLKFFELLIFPVMDPSGFCFHLEIIGIEGSTFDEAGVLAFFGPKRENDGDSVFLTGVLDSV